MRLNLRNKHAGGSVSETDRENGGSASFPQSCVEQSELREELGLPRKRKNPMCRRKGMSYFLPSTTETLSTRKIWSNECLDLTNQISHPSPIKRIQCRDVQRMWGVVRCSALYDLSWKCEAKREFPQYWQIKWGLRMSPTPAGHMQQPWPRSGSCCL